MTYLLKQLVDVFTAPLTVALVLVVVGGLCRWRHWRRLSTTLLFAALTIAYCGSLTPVGDALIGRLEQRHPPLAENSVPANIAAVVVLGSGYRPRDGFPVTSAFDEEGLARIVEGVRLLKRFPGAKLVMSGGAPPNLTPSALGYARVARELGVPEEALMVLDRPLDTDEEADAVAQLFGSTPFILVTSASHMPRAVRLMERAGAAAVPAPTGHRAWGMPKGCWRCWLPTAAGLRKTERALHEYVGLAALQLHLD